MKVKFKQWNCDIRIRHYNNDRIVLQLVDEKTGSSIATATVNIPDAILDMDEVCIKDYSENTGMLACLVEAGIVTDTGKRIQSGFVTIPICIYHPD
jgi:hypothetical protein